MPVAGTTALASGNSSASRTSSSSLTSRAAVSDTVLALTRPTSRAIERCSGARRGCAARATRCSALLRAASSGSTLPVNWACCCASRIADSISTTRFSSRERDRLCINSSSWLRCSATSLRRASATAARAAVSRASSMACRATARASPDCAMLSALWRASCSCIAPKRCHRATAASITAAARTSASTAAAGVAAQRDAADARFAPCGTAAPCGSVVAGSDAGPLAGLLMPAILSTRRSPRRWAVTRKQRQIRRCARPVRFAHGWPPRTRPTSRSRPSAAPDYAPPGHC